MLNRMVPTPYSYLYLREEIDKTIFVFLFKILDFFFKNHQKKSGKKKTQRGGLYPLGSKFNAESNGTNPYSYLHYTWRNRKTILYFFQNFRFFSKTIKKSRERKKPRVGGYTP